ncbi:MAG: zinc ribbon domain-containing protein [Asgard group archaeon]|nr:zinc ribbon domain-containing protein [Asgard group archaeon]
MGYLKGFFTSLAITYPSFLFIHIYFVEGTTIQSFFQNMINFGTWNDLAAVCKTAIFEPINVFFTPPNAIMIAMAFLPWVITAFIVSFFFRKKHAARGGFSTIISFMLSVTIYYYLMVENETFSIDMFGEANIFYGFLVVIGLTTIIGLLSGLISPFKKDKIEYEREEVVAQTGGEIPQPYYMPTESPSRDEYMETQRSPVERTRPTACEYCGSYLDPDSEFCSVCGNRVFNDY